MLFFKLFSCGLYNACCRCRKCHALNNLAVVLKEFDSVPSLFVSRNALRKDLGNRSDSLLQIFSEDFLRQVSFFFMGNFNGLVDQLVKTGLL